MLADLPRGSGGEDACPCIPVTVDVFSRLRRRYVVFRENRESRPSLCSHLDDLILRRRRQSGVVLSQARQIAADRFPHALERIFPRPALAVAPRQRWTTRHLPAVFIRLEHHQQSADFAVVSGRGFGAGNRGGVSIRAVRCSGVP